MNGVEFLVTSTRMPRFGETHFGVENEGGGIKRGKRNIELTACCLNELFRRCLSFILFQIENSQVCASAIEECFAELVTQSTGTTGDHADLVCHRERRQSFWYLAVRGQDGFRRSVFRVDIGGRVCG